jgi:hypothetical protein
MTSPSASATDNIQLSLKSDDIRLLVQSLDHCLATCHHCRGRRNHRRAGGTEVPARNAMKRGHPPGTTLADKASQN